MAWTNEIDPTKPGDNDLTSSGDDQIRELKSALAERMQSLLPGWPADDPLYLRAAQIGTFANRPATPVGDGHLYIASDSGVMYYGLSGAWVIFSAGTGSPPWSPVNTVDPVTGITLTDSSTCAAEVPTYKFDAEWVNGDATLKTVIFVNGVLVHTADAAATTAADLTNTALSGTQYVLLSFGHFDEDAGLLGPLTHVIWKPANPCVAATGILPLANFTTVDASTTGPDYMVDIEVARQTPSQHVDIYRDGALVFTMAPGVSTWTDENPTGEAMNVYTAVPREGVNDGPPMTRAIYLLNPDAAGLAAPTNLQATDISTGCDATPTFRVRLTWTNTESEEIRVYAREGTDAFAVVATLAAGTSSVDLTGPPYADAELWEFYLTHWNDPTESGESNHAAWFVSCDE